MKTLSDYNIFTTPESVQRPLYHGRTAGTDIPFDRDYVNKSSVVLWPNCAITWQFGNGVDSFNGVSTLQPIVNSMYSNIVRELQARRLITIRDTVLDNLTPNPVYPGNLQPLSLSAWLNSYTVAFLGIRALESILASADYNYTTSLLAAAVNQNLPQLEAAARQLRLFPVPQMLVDLLDKLCGVKIRDAESSETAIIYGLPQLITTGMPDYTLAATVGTALNIIQIALSTLANIPAANPGGVNQNADFQRINNTFALAYGNQYQIGEKGVSNDPAEYYMMLNSGFLWVDTTSAKQYELPNPTQAVQGSSTGIIPTLVHKSTTDEQAKYALSLFAGWRYSTDTFGLANATLPNGIGLYQNPNPYASATASNFVTYDPNGGYHSVLENGAAAKTVSWEDPMIELSLWLPPAALELITGNSPMAEERRTFSGFDIVKPRVSDMIDATAYWLYNCFLDSIV